MEHLKSPRHLVISCVLPCGGKVQDGLAHTPLHWAARQGFEGISQALVSAQAW